MNKVDGGVVALVVLLLLLEQHWRFLTWASKVTGGRLRLNLNLLNLIR